MLFPDDVRQSIERRYKNNHREWIDGNGKWPLAISLGIPTQREASDAKDSVRAWVEAWSNWHGLPGELTWENRQWRWLGAQRLPARLVLTSPQEVAEWIGEGACWARLVSRMTVLTTRWPSLTSSGVLSGHFHDLSNYSDADFDRLVRFAAWFTVNPASGLYPRQLPVEGIDTKWLEAHQALVADILRSVLGIREGDTDFHIVCGLRRAPKRIRLRILCPVLARVLGGLRDIEAPIEEVAQMALKPQSVLIVENLETGLALPDIASTMVVLKLGHAVTLLRDLQWIHSARCLYWGDIDTHGFAILDRARDCLQQVQSVLMDENTLLTHRALWTEEKIQCNPGELGHLQAHEREVFCGLRSQKWGTNVRLEQERIPWDYALLELDRVSLRVR